MNSNMDNKLKMTNSRLNTIVSMADVLYKKTYFKNCLVDFMHCKDRFLRR